MSNTNPKYRWILHLPLAILGILMISLIFLIGSYGGYSHKLLATGEVLIRYLLALPGALFSSWALQAQLPQFKDLANSKAVKDLLHSSLVMIGYAIFAGLIVPDAPFFPANGINEIKFFSIVGLPVQVFRAFLGLSLVYYVIHLLEIFKLEHNRRLEDAERNQAILKERESIGRDLHDGTIQAIYAVGLSLENCRYLSEENLEYSMKEIDHILFRLNDIIKDIRSYTSNLRPDPWPADKFQERFLALINHFKKNSSIHTDINIIRQTVAELTAEQGNHAYHLLQEALTNIIRHSKATSVEIRMIYGVDGLELMISDNGCGFSLDRLSNYQVSGEGQGLRNASERVKIMGGQLEIHTTPGEGTKLIASIPYEERATCQKSG
ncbi:MAG: sensor histidine kinase [Bacillota bacterium]